MIANIQLLRIYAALGVVVLHSGLTFGAPHGSDYNGVAIFFVITGYLMAGFADRGVRGFLLRRLIRLCPLYWLMTLLTVYLFGGFAWHSWRDVAMSLLFIPHVSQQGGWYPTLGVGWTLVIEMFFYAAFAAGIALAGRRAALVAALILAAMQLARLAWPQHPVWLSYFGHVYALYLLQGLAIHALAGPLTSRFGPLLRSWWQLPALMALNAALAAASGWSWTISAFSSIAMPALLVAAAIILARTGRDLRSRGVLLLADASYSLYLSHTLIIEYMRHKGVVIFGSPALFLPYVAASLLTAVFLWLTVEKPALAALKRLLLPEPHRLSAAA